MTRFIKTLRNIVRTGLPFIIGGVLVWVFKTTSDKEFERIDGTKISEPQTIGSTVISNKSDLNSIPQDTFFIPYPVNLTHSNLKEQERKETTLESRLDPEPKEIPVKFRNLPPTTALEAKEGSQIGYMAIKSLKNNGFYEIISGNMPWVLWGNENYRGFVNISAEKNNLKDPSKMPIGFEVTFDFSDLPQKFKDEYQGEKLLGWEQFTANKGDTIGDFYIDYCLERNVYSSPKDVWDQNGIVDRLIDYNIEINNLNPDKVLRVGDRFDIVPEIIRDYYKEKLEKQEHSYKNPDGGWISLAENSNELYKQNSKGKWITKNKGVRGPGVYISKAKALELNLA